ncbi:MAG TPA: hypothetical protein VGL62_12270, partial [Vicinamibacterales bacterium]
MEQRRLRLGDILDDYCPRERRVTNHAVVAMVEDDVKQTRCATCDTEHPYKGARAPRRRGAESPGRLYKEVLAGIDPDRAQDQPPAAEDAAGEGEGEFEPAAPEPQVVEAAESSDQDAASDDDREGETPIVDDGPVHRPLIRAQLPRPEGMKIERTAPEFTIRQNAGRGGGFRRDGNGRGGARNAGHQRFGQGQGQ